jgi:hypothetical protein
MLNQDEIAFLRKQDLVFDSILSAKCSAKFADVSIPVSYQCEVCDTGLSVLVMLVGVKFSEDSENERDDRPRIGTCLACSQKLLSERNYRVLARELINATSDFTKRNRDAFDKIASRGF